MAGGASGVSLRGLTVDATWCWSYGHRMATYPLADDGQRPLRRHRLAPDSESSIGGSAERRRLGDLWPRMPSPVGLNIITKRLSPALDVSTNLGSSYKGDGLEQRLSATYGFGNLSNDGHNVYFNVEYRHQAEISKKIGAPI